MAPISQSRFEQTYEKFQSFGFAYSLQRHNIAILVEFNFQAPQSNTQLLIRHISKDPRTRNNGNIKSSPSALVNRMSILFQVTSEQQFVHHWKLFEIVNESKKSHRNNCKNINCLNVTITLVSSFNGRIEHDQQNVRESGIIEWVIPDPEEMKNLIDFIADPFDMHMLSNDPSQIIGKEVGEGSVYTSSWRGSPKQEIIVSSRIAEPRRPDVRK